MSTDDLRASDEDRDRTAEIVRQAATEGRLDFTELEDRLEQVFAAKTYGELARVTRDLPNAVSTGQDAQGQPGRRAGDAGIVRPGPSEISAIFGEETAQGSWLVPQHIRLRAIFGEVKLDFTEATVPHEVVVDAQVALGQVTMIVPDDIAVTFDGGPTMLGSRTNKTQAIPRPGTPVIRVRGLVFLGELVARPPRRWFGRFGR